MEFLTTFKITFLATAQIFLMGGLGYFLVKKKIIDHNGLVLLSRLVISLFFPLFSFYQLTTHFSFTAYSNWWVFPLISLGITFVGFTVGWIMTVLFKGITFKKEFISLIGLQNSGFIPLVLVATMFSGERAQQLYVCIFLFLIGFDLVIWSFGVWFLTKHKVDRFDITNLLYSPFTAILLSLIFVYFGWNQWIPLVVMKPIKMLSDCALPMAVLVVGGNLATIDVFAVNVREIVLAVFGKLILLPTLALLFVLFFHVEPLLGFITVLQAAVPSANSLSVIARQHKIDGELINQGVFFTNVISVITLAVFLTLYMRLFSFF